MKLVSIHFGSGQNPKQRGKKMKEREKEEAKKRTMASNEMYHGKRVKEGKPKNDDSVRCRRRRRQRRQRSARTNEKWNIYIHIKNWLVIWRHCTDSMHTACCSKTMHRLDARRDKTRQPNDICILSFFVCSHLPLLLLLFFFHIIWFYLFFIFESLSSVDCVCGREFFFSVISREFISCFKYDCCMRAFSLCMP